jgi:hypothetical protein
VDGEIPVPGRDAVGQDTLDGAAVVLLTPAVSCACDK